MGSKDRANALRAPRHSGFAPSQQSSLPSRPFGECRLSQNEATALLAWEDTSSDFDGLSFKTIARRSGLAPHLVRRTVRALARKGLTVFHRCLWTDDGEPCGAGYGLTELGRRIMNERWEARSLEALNQLRAENPPGPGQ